MATITCKIPAKLDARLAAAARQQRVSKSAIVRQALEHHVSRMRTRKRPTVYDLAKDLIGSLHGPGDLLTNPKYMEDFGA